MSHRIPFVSLTELSYRIDVQHLSEDERLYLLADDSKDIRQQQFRRETEHLPDRAEINGELRHPSCEIIFDDGCHRNIDDLLPCQTPVAISVPCQPYATAARDYEGSDACNGLFAIAQFYP